MNGASVRFAWDFEWRLTLFSLLLFPALVSLGFWQLDRAEEKVALAAAEQARSVQRAQSLASLLSDSRPAELAFTPVELRGRFHPEWSVLKDNQLREGRYGVDVLGLFYDEDAQRWALLNRGWVLADPARRSLPAIEIPAGEITVQAAVYMPPGDPYTLAPENTESLEWPLLAQDPSDPLLQQAIATALGAELFPLELRLAPDQPGGFRRDWPLVNSSPAKHRGYALQWFTMAAALLVLFVLRSSNLWAVLRGRRGQEPGAGKATEHDGDQSQ